MQKIVTKESLVEMLKSSDQQRIAKIVGRALLAIYLKQTVDERSASATMHHNNVGFTACDAEYGSSCAKFFQRNGYLTYNQVKSWIALSKSGTPKIAKYWRQLNEVANSKMTSKSA